MAQLDELTLEGASILIKLLILATNSILDPGSYHGRLAFHRISPFECLYELTATIVDIVHFILYSSHDDHSGIVFLVANEDYLPLRLALNIPSILHAYKFLRLEDAYWSKVFAASYLLCWLFAKIYPMRSQQLTVAETHRIRRKVTNPVFFALSHCLVCFAVFSDSLEAALWSWFGILVIAGFTLVVRPMPPLVNPHRDAEYVHIAAIVSHFVCLGMLWLFKCSPFALSLKVKNQDWRDNRSFKVAAILLFDGAMVFLVATRTRRWSISRFAFVGLVLAGMAYVHYIELYPLTQGTKALLG
ncbi:hypothetical protein KCU91_g1371, partial [Aureobasidium melanogenum]